MEVFDDIINLPHHVSKKHPQMSISDRLEFFDSFDALESFDDSINETDDCQDMDELPTLPQHTIDTFSPFNGTLYD